MSTKKMVGAFYGVVLATALVGSTAAAAEWLEVDWRIAVVPVAAVELGGVVLSMFATDRRKLGEGAIVARALSALVALTAVAVNVFGHPHFGQAAFFGTMSALGYAVYLLISAAKRRDALRAAGKLEDTAPSYGAWQWLRHPGLTRRARILAITGKLGKLTSLASAREQVRAERREVALARSLRARIAASAGRDMAAIAVDTYDMNEIARRLAAGADYDGMARLFGAELTAERLTGGPTPKPTHGGDLEALVEVVTPAQVERVEAVVSRPKRQVPVELDRVWSELVSQHPAVYGSAPMRQLESAQRPARESVRESRSTRTVAAQGRPTTRRKKRLTVTLTPDQRMAQAFGELTDSLGREPSGTELAAAAQVSKATANRWKSQRDGESS